MWTKVEAEAKEDREDAGLLRAVAAGFLVERASEQTESGSSPVCISYPGTPLSCAWDVR